MIIEKKNRGGFEKGTKLGEYRNKKKSGVRLVGYADSFRDVFQACEKWEREKIRSGELEGWINREFYSHGKTTGRKSMYYRYEKKGGSDE